MSDNRLSEPNATHTIHKEKANHWLRRTFLVVAMLLLISVITSNFFHLPMYDETGRSTVIVMAMMIFSLSTVFEETKSK